MPLATQTIFNLVPHVKDFTRSFKSRQSGGKESDKPGKDSNHNVCIPDGGVVVETDDGEELTLGQLKARTSTTAKEDRDYCPVKGCHTIKVFRKTGDPDLRERREPWRCANGHHFDRPIGYDDLPTVDDGGRQ